jgi:integrase
MSPAQATPETGDPAVARLLDQLRATEMWLADARDTATELANRRATLLATLHRRGISIRALAAESRLSRSAYRYALRPVVEQLGAIPVQKLTEADVERLVKVMREGTTKHGKWRATSVNPMLARLRKVLDDLVRTGVVTRNVAQYVESVPVPHEERYEAPTWTRKQVSVFKKAIIEDPLEHAWHLALLGLRRGELGGMRWEDVDFAAGVIHVRGNRVAVPGGSETGGTKTVASERSLPLPAPIVTVLKKAKKRQAAEKLAAGPRYRGTGEWVVCNSYGRPLHPDTISDKWSAAVKAAGLPYISLHPARHTALTLMHLGGKATADIAAIAGHRDAAFTVRRYTHSQPESLRDALDYLSSDVIEDDDAGAVGES